MNDPWQILILDPHTATEKDVKAAYARLLKQHRPDTDPEGFRRVREAYEMALDWLRERAASYLPPEVTYAETPPGDGQGDGAENSGWDHGGLPVVFEDLPLSPEAQEALAEAESAADSGNAEQLEAALVAIEQRCEESGASGTSRATALERAFHGRVETLAGAVPDDMLLRLAELGQLNFPHLMVSAWQEAEERTRLAQFGSALLKHARAFATPDGAMLLARVGMLTGLEQPEVAVALANAAYPHLPVDARSHIMAQLEQEAAVGRVFASVTPALKPFWFQRVRRGEDGFDWDSADARIALSDVIERNRYLWQGWGVVRQLMPDAHWAGVEQRLIAQSREVARNTKRPSSLVWLVVPVIFVVLNLLRFLGHDRPLDTSERTAARQEMEKLGDTTQKGLNEFNRWKQQQKAEEARRAKAQKEVGASAESDNSAPASSPLDPPAPSPADEEARREAQRRAIQNGSFFDGTLRPPTTPTIPLR